MKAMAAAPIVLVAHGSRDPRASATTLSLVRAVRAARPGVEVHAAFLDHGPPRPGDVLRALEAAGHRRATLVPLLLTAAYHGRVDIPGAIAAARAAGLRMPVRVTGVLGPATGVVDPLLLSALQRRLRGASADVDAVVLAAAGTRDAAARATVDRAAAALGAALGVPCLAAYASAAGPTADAAVATLRAAGARRIAMAAYFLAPGRLYEVAAESARAAGAIAVAAPLGDAPEIARLVLSRATPHQPSPIPVPTAGLVPVPIAGPVPVPIADLVPVDQGHSVVLSRSNRADLSLVDA
jgi:sirohydrochlorin ferrochelatase